MQVQSMFFERKASEKLNDPRLQENLKRLSSKFVNARATSILELEDFEGTRSAAVEIRNRSIKNLDVWLELFEQKAVETGAKVLFARTPQEAAQLVVKIAKKHGVKSVIKSKSMVTEEMALNKALEAADVKVRETDLGEYILQINDNERPSHIIAPVVHKDKEQVADLFEKHHHLPRKTDIAEMTREAREILRPQFLAADMGVTGGNFIIADTGSVALVTNEGNEGMCTINPRVHVAITGVEKVVPTLEDFATLIRLLPRSATGQSISNYVSLLTGPKREGDLDGPEHMYFVILDGGRTGLLGGEFEEMLRCIKCGACMNHCPVYQKIGGHAYGWVYPGPMGSVLTPSYTGIEKALDLPQAATLCGECHVVCPVKIPLPDLLRKLREQQFSRGLRPWQEKAAFKVWAFVAQRPALYRVLSRMGIKAMAWWGKRKGGIHSLPGARGWTDQRDFPVPTGETFSNLYQQRKNK
ncbi:MAG: LutB/LldF family L-lactate oxidation iron-sulfur protein [Limnobacter sp.]|jgi:L-lactate dehydrogenase complex protein LldF|uniref:LutB/LldF family L-lactate oxidation iron-sulfur protein n=1 Tax=unclassified Limnobacter TaxID=2630203 RepID=UPI000C4C9221|nr:MULTISPECIES: LutB/LldF family L-lactate oxidation iron-sulfur protein [unclassified Limnobacter]MAG81009.1 iron-sulfur cluster-binding protein [Sutterellaceae bacterium]MBT82900.1 iron-sulfur cluster-binding protein [Sutterellaceae bacterium]MDP3272400.1 LutB/LldF family L-lactate oxidation iron-sulfur protein [Limnobacter sp.]|tara:strand:+ start:8848 stop:10257 length:1410 start_codon:yes stop_codon:yes gene_type:complete